MNDLTKLSKSEWEDLCHRCGFCCTVGNDQSGRVACELFETNTYQCRDYENRFRKVEFCHKVTPNNVWELDLPDFCGYKQYARGEPIGGPKVNAIPVTLAQGDLAKKMLGKA